MRTAREVAETYYNAFNLGDYPKMLFLVAEDVRHEPNQGLPRMGKALLSEFLKSNDAAYSEQLSDFTFLEEANGRKVAADFLVTGIYKLAGEGMPPANGQVYKLRVVAVLDVQDGLITTIRTYYNLEEWLRLVSA